MRREDSMKNIITRPDHTPREARKPITLALQAADHTTPAAFADVPWLSARRALFAKRSAMEVFHATPRKPL